jgi:AcrR family transcriptional regulator
VQEARRRFAADGYQATSLDDIVEAVGVTKGALYHHFSGKRELFTAVYEREQRRLAAVSRDAYQAKRDPWKGFYAACEAFFEASLDPGVQQITLLDAPAVLGWQGMREVEARYSLAQMNEALKTAIDEGRIAPRPVEPLAHLLMGALCEAAIVVARAEDQQAESNRFLREIKRLFSALEQRA